MKKITVYAFLLLIITFDQFFWNQDIALNFSMFSLLTILVQLVDNFAIFKKRPVQIATLGSLIASFMLVFHNSLVSTIVAVISWIVFIGFTHEDDLRTVYRAGFSSFLHYFKLPPFIFQKKNSNSKWNLNKWRNSLKIIFLPVGIVLVFFLIFRSANLVFKDVTDQIGHDIKWGFMQIFEISSWERGLFVFFGATVANWIVFQSPKKFFTKKESMKSDQLNRIREKNERSFISEFFTNDFPLKIKMLSLKNENKSGVLTMGMICFLLLIINSIDIVYVWFGYNYYPKMNFSKDVHQGVYMLIFSILLSILVMLFYFRKNQNFYSKNRLLKSLAFTWIALNFILIISVFIRNIHYINHLGLTHKRIGIFIFLLLVIFGLLSLLWKIEKRKSFFYMSKFNSWSIYLMLILMTFFNWDMIIFNHNFEQRKSIKFDRYYVLDYLSDEAILHLKMKEDLLNRNNDLNIIQDYQRYRYNTLDDQVYRIVENLKNDENAWQSWNYRKYKMRKLIGR